MKTLLTLLAASLTFGLSASAGAAERSPASTDEARALAAAQVPMVTAVVSTAERLDRAPATTDEARALAGVQVAYRADAASPSEPGNHATRVATSTDEARELAAEGAYGSQPARAAARRRP
jgi:hypothetical protein